MALPRKQRSDHADWLDALDEIRRTVDREKVERLVDAAATRVRVRVRGKRAAYAWSGGKDSEVVRLIAERAGVTECCLAICALEFPEFLAWTTDHMPHGLAVEMRTDWDLDWLAANQDMIFPPDSPVAAKWYANVNHWGQRRYSKREQVDVLLMGRRVADGNFCGPKPRYEYVDPEGFTRWMPIADWSHEAVLAVIAAYDLPLAPFYRWPRGFRVGSGPWPARRYTASPADGWREVSEIDHAVVVVAAEAGIRGAQEYLEACAA